MQQTSTCKPAWDGRALWRDRVPHGTRSGRERGLKPCAVGVDASFAMNAVAAEQFPIVVDVTEAAANEPHPRGTPIELPTGLSLWDVFVALQDAAEEEGATPDEADRLAVAAYWELSRSLVSGRGIETSSA